MAHNIPDVKALVEEFNKLPRLGNWCIGIRRIFANGYLIFAIDYSSSRRSNCMYNSQMGPFYNSKGRTPIVYHVSDPVKQANIIVPHLLDLFVSCFDMDELQSYGYGERRVAPLEWKLLDLLDLGCGYPGLMEAISAELRVLGVREDLCIVGEPCGEVEDDSYGWLTQAAVTSRSKETNSRCDPNLPEPVSGGPPPVFCAHCGFSISRLGEPLRLCGGCVETWYCDILCQWGDWRNHEKVCYEALNIAGQSQETLDSMRRDAEYYLPRLRFIEDG
jgi:MYND finger